MGNELSAAYHVRKHYREIPQIEQTGNPVADYHNSAERTIREGELTDRIKRDGGGEILNYRRRWSRQTGQGPNGSEYFAQWSSSRRTEI